MWPFLILSDINMPRINGFELRNRIYTNQMLRDKCVPYLFFTTAAGHQSVKQAYALSAQVFFVKPDKYEDLLDHVRVITEYRTKCYSPNNFNEKNRILERGVS